MCFPRPPKFCCVLKPYRNFIPEEIKRNPGILETIITTNVKSKKLKQIKPKTRQRLEGKFSSQAGSYSNFPVHPCSPNKSASKRKFGIDRVSNEGCFGGYDEEDPHQDKVEKNHMIDQPQKRKRSQKSSKEVDIFQDLDMEVGTSEQIPDWVAIWLDKREALVEELAHKGPVVFEDDSNTSHHASYQKDTKNILLQYVSIKGSWVLTNGDWKLK